MRGFNGEKLTAARTNHSDGIHAQMTPVFGQAGFSSLFVPTLSGTGIALKAGFIGLLHQLLELFNCGVFRIGNE